MVLEESTTCTCQEFSNWQWTNVISLLQMKTADTAHMEICASVTRPFSQWAYLHCELTSMLLSILNPVAHCTWGNRMGRLLHCTRARLLFGRLVSLTVIWRVGNYYNCSNVEYHSNYIQNDSIHTQSSPPDRQFCKCGDWITCLMKYEYK